MDNDYKLYLEEKFNNLNKRIDNNYDKIIEKLSHMEQYYNMKDKVHFINCQNTKDIKTINDNLLEYKFVLKYPKLVLTYIAGNIIFIIYYLSDKIGIF